MKRLLVLISGNGSNLETIIKKTISNEIKGKVKLVISNNPGAHGLIRAKNFNIPIKVIDNTKYKSRDDFENELEIAIDLIDPDLIILAGFMRILGKNIVNKYSKKMINLHPSILPLYPGIDTHKKVIKNKDRLHGISIHYVTAKLDSGPLIAQGIINVSKSDTHESIKKRIHKIEHILLPEIINDICVGNIKYNNGLLKFKSTIKTHDNIIIKNYEI